MKKTIFNKAELIIGFTLIFLVLSIQKSGSQTICTEPGTSWIAGVQDGYRYELWNQNSEGTACMTLGSGALFSGEWEDVENYLARRGLGYDQTQEHQEIGTFSATYNCNYNPSTASGNSYLAVYGWTVDPLVEYYIVEDWRNWIPSMAGDATHIGSFDADGSTYDIVENTRVNQPSILGNATFEQYFSIRRDVRNSGSINISDHFNKWESQGLDMGNMYEVSFVVEGYQNSGSFEFTSLDVIVNSASNITESTLTPINFSVYPNPSSGNVTVKINESLLHGNLKIYTMLGEVIFSQENITNNLIQVSNLESGVYFASVYSNKLSYTTKFVVY